ncbi:MerR family transcriptional regulator [Aquabacterium sp.]|uniref:MerR family transcriptional regulator n=1 Tax=Aquabacterium sp. TaxID=1872578 RepID=UPI00378436A0
MTSPRRRPAPASPAVPGPAFRSAAVARMARMPVATLRIWEQRYRAVQPATTAAGHRLYSPADVQRVLLLRQLTEQGHAIGQLAGLDSAQLQAVARTPAVPAASESPGPARARPALRLVVVGPALAARLQRPALLRQRVLAPHRLTVFDSLADAARAPAGTAADLLLWHAPELRPELPRELKTAMVSAQKACRARQVAVLYRYAGSAAIHALADTGAVVIREPADDAALGAWLASLPVGRSARSADRAPRDRPPAAQAPGTVPPRRYDDAALTAIAGLPPRLACECPRHVAELLMQLASFEAYSAGCRHRNAADADLHAYLQQVAGASRALFEAALERVARHEGLALG